jgi:hypothetical protein
MQFKFTDTGGNPSGFLAFTDGESPHPHLLLVTDAGNNAVHVIDVVAQSHLGHVAPLRSISGPRGVATKGPVVAVSAWRSHISAHLVHVFQGSVGDGPSWCRVRVLGGGFGGPGDAAGQLHRPYGLRFTADGSRVAVADWGNRRVSVFNAGDGAFDRHASTELPGPFDVEDCGGGWLVACDMSNSVEFVASGATSSSPSSSFGRQGEGHGEFSWPTALALVPDLGLAVREFFNGGRLQVFAARDPSPWPPCLSCGPRGWPAWPGRSSAAQVQVLDPRVLQASSGEVVLKPVPLLAGRCGNNFRGARWLRWDLPGGHACHDVLPCERRV